MKKYTIRNLDKYNEQELKNIKVLFDDDTYEISGKLFMCENLEYLSTETTIDFIVKNANKFAKLKNLNQLILTEKQHDEYKYNWITIPNIVQYEDCVLIRYLSRCDNKKNNNLCYCSLLDNYDKIKNINIMNVVSTSMKHFFDNLPNNLEFLKITNYNSHYNKLCNLPFTLKKLILVYSTTKSDAEIEIILENIKLPYGCKLIIMKELEFTGTHMQPSIILYKSS